MTNNGIIKPAIDAADIVIDERWMRQIKRVQLILKDETNEENKKIIDDLYLDELEITEFCVFPAMYEYFSKFPSIKFKTQTRIQQNSSTEFPFPNPQVFNVKKVSVVGKLNGSSNGSNFLDIIRYNQMRGTYNNNNGLAGSYSSRYDFGGMQDNVIMQKQVLDSLVNESTTKYFVNEEERILTVYSSTSGEVFITWAATSNDFADIKHTRKLEVVELAQGYLLQHLADLAGILNDQALDLEINVDRLQQRSETLINRVREKWAAFPSILALPMT